MVMALIAFAVGSLVITPTLSYMASGVKSSAIHQRLTGELYAADAGVEYAMWCIKNDESCDTSITVDGITVAITLGELSELPYGPVVTGDGVHADRLQVSSDLVADGDGTTFTHTYNIIISNVGPSTIKLEIIGARLPDGFTYNTGSSSGVTSADPQPDGSKITWDLGVPAPSVSSGEEVTQTFRIWGTGTPDNYYSWVEARDEDIGVVSSCLGYNIIAQAGSTTIEANVVKNDSVVFPASWEIN